MNALEIITNAAQGVGYRKEAVVANYSFADVLSSVDVTRQVALAIFTQTPPSYRSAALAVVEREINQDSIDTVMSYRALGAPLLFLIEGDTAVLWQIRTGAPPRILERVLVTSLPELFERNRDSWRPEAIHRAKSIGVLEGGYQLDFVDIGLLPAIENEIHVKLDRLLIDAFADAKKASRKEKVDTRLLFRVVFRLLAAKVLQDRKSAWAARWSSDDLPSVLHGIETYYSLEKVPLVSGRKLPAAFEAVWDRLRSGISFANISADDLSFVYENTLITPETRKLFGTHSTPRQVAEYAVQRLELHRHDPENLRVYEPFAGAGIFLVSALRHLRDLLPVHWTDQQRHKFLTNHITGSEIEPFACEVAKLSLILADYPNHNGWKVLEEDLFEDRVLAKRMDAHNVILCNPPFEQFSAADRKRYAIAESTYSKSVAVLNAALDAHPIALGFVLPRPFIVDVQFREQRKRLERLYKNIEIVELPDRIFNASVVEAALVIASEKRDVGSSKITLRSTEIADRDRQKFLRTGDVTAQRRIERKIGEPPRGELWIPPLYHLWEYLSELPTLGSLFDIHLGARWTYDQGLAVSSSRKRGFKPGLFNADDVRQFAVSKISYIDLEPEHLTHALDRDWAAPKIIANAVRLSRGPWRLAAVVDRGGLAFSQQLLGFWPINKNQANELELYAAVINSPIANAFLSTRYPSHRFRTASLGEMPIPSAFPVGLNEVVSDYVALIKNTSIFQNPELRALELLNLIDAMVLSAYDLPTKLERQLLDYFTDARRPVCHSWVHWDKNGAIPGLRFAEGLSGKFNPFGKWVTKVFDPLPDSEANILRKFGE